MKIALVFGRKNSKGLPNKNVSIINGKPACEYPISAAIKSKIFDKIYVSTDSNFIKKFSLKKKCSIIDRPKYLSTDKALLSDAIYHAVKHCSMKYQNIKMFAIFLCNSVCINKDIIVQMDKKFYREKLDSITTISRFDMYSPTRSFKIKNQKIINYIPNNILKRFTNLSGDRKLTEPSYFITHSCTMSKNEVFKKKNNYPFLWMGKKIGFITQDNCIGDIDYEWQKIASANWLKKNEKK